MAQSFLPLGAGSAVYLVWMMGMFNDSSCDKAVVESNEQNAKSFKEDFIFADNLIMFFMISCFLLQRNSFSVNLLQKYVTSFFVHVT